MAKKATDETTDLAKTVESFGPLAMLAGEDASEFKSMLADNIGDAGVSMFDLDQIKMPSGGTLSWDFGELDMDPAKTFDGVILLFQDTRAYYAKGIDEGDAAGGPPDCSSMDCKVGRGDIGDGVGVRACEPCPMSQFGSARNDGRGQACSQRKLMLVLVEELGLLPVRLSAPPTSLQGVKRYSLRLTGKHRKRIRHVVTRFGLAEDTNAGGIKYAKLTCERVGDLNEADRAAVDGYQEAFAEMVKTAAPPPAADAQVDVTVVPGDPFVEDDVTEEGGLVEVDVTAESE